MSKTKKLVKCHMSTKESVVVLSKSEVIFFALVGVVWGVVLMVFEIV